VRLVAEQCPPYPKALQAKGRRVKANQTTRKSGIAKQMLSLRPCAPEAYDEVRHT
jgi:hypothetical protein